MPDTIPASRSILVRAHLTVDLLDAAVEFGLPDPRYVTIGGSERFVTIGVQLATPAEVHAWASWLGVAVMETALGDDPPGGLFRADGEWSGAQVHAYTVEYGEAAA